MKARNISFCLVFFFLFTIVFHEVKAQDGKNILKVNVIDPFFNRATIGFEGVFSDEISGQLNYSNYGVFQSDGIKRSGFEFSPELRIYFIHNKTAPQGIYWAFNGGLFSLNEEEVVGSYNYKRDESGYKLGANLGYQFFINRIALDFFGGAFYSKATSLRNSTSSGYVSSSKGEISGKALRFGLNIGYSF